MSELVEEANRETLECARYGEDEDLRNLYVTYGADPNWSDESGNTAMHRAAANGEVKCLQVLKELGAQHKQNGQGNFPIHWAALNGQLDALKFIIENYEVDVLIQNAAGRSTLSEAFQSQKTEVIEVCLSHPSATEEKLLDTKNSNDVKVTFEDSEEQEGGDDNGEKHAVIHTMDFSPSTLDAAATAGGASVGSTGTNSRRTLRVRELPITRADNPFGSETRPEDDTTGLGLWPASVLLARWAVEERELLRDKVVVELGAGCGLPGLAAAVYCSCKEVHITDIHDPTLKNAVHNIHLNGVVAASKPATTEKSTDTTATTAAADIAAGTASEVIVSHNSVDTLLSVSKVSWSEPDTFPSRKADVLLGSDLVYDSKILGLLTKAVDGMLVEGGTFLYIAPDEERDGLDGLVDALQAVGLQCVLRTPCPDSMYENPLADVDNPSVAGSSNSNNNSTNSLNMKAAAIAVATEGSNNSKPPAEGEAKNSIGDDGNKSAASGDDGKKSAAPTIERGDAFVLHFYDLAARKAHSLYKFVKRG